jgi:hypothetical protein
VLDHAMDQPLRVLKDNPAASTHDLRLGAAAGGMGATSARRASDSRPRWLAVLCCLLLSMVVLGGTTWLTRSGLSIVSGSPSRGRYHR